jgi:hypothetical protein
MSVAHLTADQGAVRLQLSTIEQLGCLRRDLEIPKEQIAGVRIEDEPFHALRGIRAPGLGVPRRLAIGRWRHRGGTDLVVLRHGERAVVLDLTEAAPFRRLVVGADAPERVVDRLQVALR